MSAEQSAPDWGRFPEGLPFRETLGDRKLRREGSSSSQRARGREAAVKIRSRWVSKLAAWLMVTGLRLWFATCRKIHIAPSHKLTLVHPEAEAQDECFIMTVWHDALVIPTFCSSPRTRRRTCGLISQHQDGGYLADSMALLGYKTVRGSSSRGGAAALKQLITDTADRHIVITPDGPRGPRRELKVGPVYLASQSGRRIVPGAFVCKRGWRIQGSWTDMLLPLPFTTIYLLAGEPLSIPAGLSREDLQAEVARVQQAMDDLDAQAEKLLATGGHLEINGEIAGGLRRAA